MVTEPVGESPFPVELVAVATTVYAVFANNPVKVADIPSEKSVSVCWLTCTPF